MEIKVSLEDKQLKKGKGLASRANPLLIGIFSLAVSFLLSNNASLSVLTSMLAFFSWRIFNEDILSFKVSNWNLAGLLITSFLLFKIEGVLIFSPVQGLLAFVLGWTIFQLYEDQIGGGDVRLVSVLALFLNFFQILSAISLASFLGIIIANKYRLKRVPFASILIITSWISFAVVQY